MRRELVAPLLVSVRVTIGNYRTSVGVRIPMHAMVVGAYDINTNQVRERLIELGSCGIKISPYPGEVQRVIRAVKARRKHAKAK